MAQNEKKQKTLSWTVSRTVIKLSRRLKVSLDVLFSKGCCSLLFLSEGQLWTPVDFLSNLSSRFHT